MFGFFFITSIFALDLHITEVFVDGSDERVEISNISSGNFIWSFTLSGVKSSPLLISNISIPEFTTLLVGDNLSMLSIPNTLTILWGRWLSLWDSVWIDVSLRDDANALVDTFIVDQSTVQSHDNTMISFQKLYNGGNFDIIPTIPLFSSWVISSSLASPWKLYRSDGSLWFPFVLSWTGDTSPWSQTTTWSTITGNQSSWMVVDCSTVWSDVVLIDEIYNGDIYNDYIELLFLQSWTGSLSFSWSAISSSFTLPPQWYKANMRYIIASGLSGFRHTDNIIVSPSFILWSGEITIQDPLSMLSYYADTDNTWQSVYFSDSNTCIQNIALPGNPSPWFDRQFLWYLSTQTVTNTIIQTITGSCTTWSNTSWFWSLTGYQQTGWNLLSGMFSFHDIRISLIDYDPPGSDTNTERLWLTLFTWDWLSLSGWLLWYDGKTYKFLSWMLMSGSEYIRTADFGFVNSRTVCISLYYLGIVIDTVCYDPSIQLSPVYPLVTWTGSSSTTTGDDETFDYANLQFDITAVNYDPDGSDTDRETVTLSFLWWASWVVLDNLRLRVGTTNKRIYWTIVSGQILTLMGNFQMPNTRSTCIALSYNEIIYDEYCYNPSVSTPLASPSSQNTTSDTSLYTNRLIQIITVGYDPDGSDTDRETVTLFMTWSQPSVDLSKLYVRFWPTKRYLNGMLYSDIQTIVTGNFQMPNSKSTCVDLMEGSHIFDTYCYAPWDDEDLWTGDIQIWDIQPLVTWIDRKEYYSGLQLQRILPNPKDKDIKNLNEKFALYRWSWSWQILTKHVKILVGKTSLSLSWRIFDGKEMIIASPKALTNQDACMRLLIDWDEIDTFCYPQAKEWLIYYHPRLQTGPQTIPSSLIASLDAQWVNLSDLVLKKSWKQICLTYKKVQIRCMNGGSTSTSKKNKALLSLWNAYIRKMSELVYEKQMDYMLMEQWRKSYRTLSDAIKWWNLWTLSVYGKDIKVTDIESYVAALYSIDEDEYLTDQLTHIFFWHQAVDDYYEVLY